MMWVVPLLLGCLCAQLCMMRVCRLLTFPPPLACRRRRYFHASNLSNWSMVAKPVRGSTAKHKGKAAPVFTFRCGAAGAGVQAGRQMQRRDVEQRRALPR